MSLSSFLSYLFPPLEPIDDAPRKALNRFYKTYSGIPTDYTVIDLETSGLDACTAEILEIGAIRYRNNIADQSFRTYVQPVGKIPHSASQINNITWRKVCKAPLLEDIRHEFFSFIGDDVLVGHNIGFDIKFIQTRFEITLHNECLDTLELSKIAFPDMPNYKLNTLRNRLSLYGGIAHTAQGDCETTAELLKRISGSEEVRRHFEEVRAYQERADAIAAKIAMHHAEVMAKKAEARLSSPSVKELRAVSKSMQGTSRDYIHKAIMLLIEKGYSEENLLIDSYLCGTECKPLRYRSIPFFAVKDKGQLRYVVIDVPPEKIKCDFLCAPSSVNEGEYSTRIYVQSPDDLEQIKEYLYAAYEKAVDTSKHSHFDLFS